MIRSSIEDEEDDDEEEDDDVDNKNVVECLPLSFADPFDGFSMDRWVLSSFLEEEDVALIFYIFKLKNRHSLHSDLLFLLFI